MTRRSPTLFGLSLLFLLSPLGCTPESRVGWKPHSDEAGMGETAEEHCERLRRDERHTRRALTDDLDLLFLTERPTRLSRWHD